MDFFMYESKRLSIESFIDSPAQLERAACQLYVVAGAALLSLLIPHAGAFGFRPEEPNGRLTCGPLVTVGDLTAGSPVAHTAVHC